MPDSPDQYVSLANAREIGGKRHEKYSDFLRDLRAAARSVPILPPGHVSLNAKAAERMADDCERCEGTGYLNDFECPWCFPLRAALAAAKDTP